MATQIEHVPAACSCARCHRLIPEGDPAFFTPGTGIICPACARFEEVIPSDFTWVKEFRIPDDIPEVPDE